MNNHRILKTLALAYLVVALLFMVGEYFLQALLDQVLQNYNSEKFNNSPDVFDVAIAVALLIFFVAHFASLIGLLKYKRWAMKWFMLTMPLAVVTSLFSDAVVQHSISYFLDHISSMIGGGLMVFLWLSHNWYITSCSSMTKRPIDDQ